MRQPTPEECTANALLDFDGDVATYAIWYPQMGGYIARAAVSFGATGSDDACFDMAIWHDGEFPFDEDAHGSPPSAGRRPAYLHHCLAEQFVRFGETVARLQRDLPGIPRSHEPL